MAAPILYVSHVSTMSGAEESLLALMSAIDRERFIPALACPPGELAARATEMGMRVFPLPMTRFRSTHNPIIISGYALAWVISSNLLRKVIHEVRPALLHANSAAAQIYSSSSAEKAGVPSVWQSRDLRPLPFPAMALCRNAARIIAVSDAVASFLSESGLIQPQVVRIYGGIDAEAWRARVSGREMRAELHLPADARTLLVAAQFAPWKRHEDAMRALAIVLQREPAAHLVFAGSELSGEYPALIPSLQKLETELGIQGKVHFAGQRKDIADLMSTAELTLLPSEAEPFGRAAIEAMALGKPVVGTRAGGLPEVVQDGETGLLAAPRDPDSLARACVRVLENHTLAERLGRAGKARVEAVFNIKTTAEETQRLYDSVISGR